MDKKDDAFNATKLKFVFFFFLVLFFPLVTQASIREQSEEIRCECEM